MRETGQLRSSAIDSFGAVHVTVDLDRHPEARSAFALAAGSGPATAEYTTGNDPLCIWQGPRDWLIVCDPDSSSELAERLRRALMPWPSLVNDVSDALCAFEIAGGEAVALLAGGISLDLEPDIFSVGKSAVTRLSQLWVTLVHLPGNEEGRYRLFADHSRAGYLGEWLAHMTRGLTDRSAE